MTIVVLAGNDEYEALTADPNIIDWIKADENFTFSKYCEADAFFILKENIEVDFAQTDKPVFINSVSITLKQLLAPQQLYRINAWPGFLQRPVWEIAGAANDVVFGIATALNKKLLFVRDEPGLVSAKIIAMIINEAYFAFSENVSSKEEIDTAMKLGTNYPYGPFEWATAIGLKNINSLLTQLSNAEKRYQPSILLTKEALES